MHEGKVVMTEAIGYTHERAKKNSIDILAQIKQIEKP